MLISLPLSGAVYFLTKSVYSAFSCFLAGIFVDLDHIVDYLIHSNFKFSIKEFFDTCYNYRLKKFYLIMHSYEILILSWVMYFILKNEVLLGINIGYTVHLLSDQFGNFTKLFTYFFTFRLIKKFEKVFKGSGL